MTRALDIGHNDLRLFLKRKSAYVWLFVVPLAFVYIMGFANRGAGDPTRYRPAVLVENLDTNFFGRIFMEELGAQGMRLVDLKNRESAARGVRIPSDFTSSMLQHKKAQVEFFEREGSSQADAAMIQFRVVRALVALNGHLLEATSQAGPSVPLSEGTMQEIMAKPDSVQLSARFAGRRPVPSGFNFSLPGNLVMFMMMNLLIFGGVSMAAERRRGVIKRLMVHPVGRHEIVLGKIYGLMLLGTVQVLYFLLLGKFLFRVNLGANLPGVTIVMLVFAWVAGSLGILAGSLISAEDRVAGVCWLSGMLMAAVGGCWWPLEIVPAGLKTAAYCLPTSWALIALHQLISFGSGFNAVLKPLAVLVGFAVTSNVLAARFFRN